MISYSWTFPTFVIVPQLDGMTNVVTGMNWVCTGTDGSISSSYSGNVMLQPPNPTNFIPYADITQELAFSWLGNYINIDSVQNSVARDIAFLETSRGVPTTPPFS